MQAIMQLNKAILNKARLGGISLYQLIIVGQGLNAFSKNDWILRGLRTRLRRAGVVANGRKLSDGRFRYFHRLS